MPVRELRQEDIRPPTAVVIRPLRADEQVRRPPNVDASTGAPLWVRALVGGATKESDRLATIKQFFPDAFRDPQDPENFIFTNPTTELPTLYNPKGPDYGDIASVTRDISIGVGAGIGAGLGTAGGAVLGGPPGAVAGGIAGAGAGGVEGDVAFQFAANQLGAVDTRTPQEKLADYGTTAAASAGGQAVGAVVAGPLLRAAVKRGFGAGGREAGIVGERVAAFEQTGVIPTVGQATRKRYLDSFEGILARMPGGSAPFFRKVVETTDKVGAYVERQAAKVSPRGEPELAGRGIQTGAENFSQRIGAKYETLMSGFSQHVNQDALINPSQTIAALKAIAGDIEGAPSLSGTKLVRNPALREFLDALEKDAAENGGLVPYRAFDAVRKRVGIMTRDTGLISDIPTGQARQVYKAMLTDTRRFAEDAGPDAVKSFERASQYYKAGIQRVDDFLNPLARKIQPEKIVSQLMASGKEGATALRAVRRSVSKEEWNAVASTVIRRLGRATPGLQTAEGEAFDIGTFLSNWNKLAPEAKDAFFGGMGDLKSNLDTVARVAQIFRENTRAFANPSGTAGASIGQAMTLGGLSAAAFGTVTGNPEMLRYGFAIALGAMSANGSARLMTNPTFVKWLAKSTEIAPNSWGAHIGRLGAIAATADPGTRQDIMDYMTALASPAVPKQQQPNYGGLKLK